MEENKTSEEHEEHADDEESSAHPTVRRAPTKIELEQMVGELKDRVAQLETEAKEREELLVQTSDRMLRALAEAQNARRRAAEERVRALALQKDRVLASFLPVLDHLRLALDSGGAGEESLAEGLRLILRQAEDVLRSHGVTRFGAQGQPFDPLRHEAVERVVTSDSEPGTVLEVTSPGFEREGRVLREAKVKVAAEPIPAEGDQPEQAEQPDQGEQPDQPAPQEA